VAVAPRHCEGLKKAGIEVLVEHRAGVEAGYPDEAYAARGAELVDRQTLFARADLIAQIRTHGANPIAGGADLAMLRPGQAVVGFGEPLTAAQECTDLAASGVSSFAISSMSTIAGYEAVLIAATRLPKMFPMLMTAAGTIAPAKVFVLGAGVAGLQAIATARRLGAVVSAYDVRPVVKEQVESVGGKFIVLDVDSKTSEDKGGYAKAMDESFYRRQRELMTEVIREQDVLIATAAVPGRKAPILVTRDMVLAMQSGSVIVDIAAERGGNCEVTRPGESIVEQGVLVLGPLNVPSMVPYHASQMYSSNITSFIKLLFKNGSLNIDLEDEIIRETLVTHESKIVHSRVLEAMQSQLGASVAR
jgi:NAD(P) transhydrogenase subunit alpha